MRDHQDIEINESMTISLDSWERGNASAELVVDVRIVWSTCEGIYAEPLTWCLVTYIKHPKTGDLIPQKGRPREVGHRHSESPMDVLIHQACNENYDPHCLQGILNEDPSFEGAWLYTQAEEAGDRADMRRQQI